MTVLLLRLRLRSNGVLALAVAAFAVTIAYALWLQPEWETGQSDQAQYAALARGLAERGEFTRATGGEAFIPEPLRSPGYPLFVAALCRTAGCGHWQVALAQALLAAVLVVLTNGLARRLLPPRPALAATALVALYPAFPYFAALEMSDFFATALAVAAGAAFVRARDTRRVAWAVACGLLLGWLAIVRVVFGAAIVLIVAGAIALDRRALLRRERWLPLLALALAFGLVLAPFLAYSYASFGTLSTSSGGSGLWYGYFQRLDARDADAQERAEAALVQARIDEFDAVADRQEQVRAWVALDRTFREHAQLLIASHPLQWIARGAERSLVLWAGDRPARGGTVPSTLLGPLLVLELLLFVVGLVGALSLARRGDAASVLPLAVILYVWAVSVPFVTEERYALPAKPYLLIAVVAGIVSIRSWMARRGGPSASRRSGRAATGAAAPRT